VRSFEDVLNVISDLDQNWWPFVFLRPERHQKITWARTALLAILYGVFAGTLVNALVKLGGGEENINPWMFPVGATVGFFLVFRMTFAFGWNRRAARLSPLQTPPTAEPDTD
jgi:hypothetical protein